ncbi:MAG: outer membrane protein assembly factor BamE [Alphaproteobacteria bacterium]|nr:outer membrane protein assembly factor BamE [Alphaproteobacteria bacterium]
MTAMRRFTAMGALLFALAACAASEHVDGQLPNPEKLAAVEIGVHTRDDVAKLIGSPSTTPPFDDDSWYYIKRVTQQVAFFEPVLMDQKIVAIVFGKEGTVADIILYHEEDGHEIAMVERITPTQGRKLSVWEQLLSNFGRLPGGSPGADGSGSGVGGHRLP